MNCAKNLDGGLGANSVRARIPLFGGSMSGHFRSAGILPAICVSSGITETAGKMPPLRKPLRAHSSK
jgi:hypothetical protein